ncbi:hypothetical protein QP162_22140 [Sphingomonas aurantiaca]|uniref:hypothetical protein n=1 Tax=Sphingomonas aurantiaca TaxID=185949 RepID=UPI002FDF9D67
MTRASGSDKANDVAKAGRFGLGQKSLFNLCDAFIVQGWLTESLGAVEHRIVNPYVALDSDGTDTAALTWEEFGEDDRAALGEAFVAAGFAGQGVAIYIPFRSSFIRPSPGAGFSNSEPVVDEIIASYCSTDRIAIVTAALRNLNSIEISASGAARLVLTAEPGGVRLAGPSTAGSFSRDVGGTIIGSSFITPVRYCGEERQLPDRDSAVFTDDGRWPATIDERHRRVPEKAAAHAAAIVARSPSALGATLNIHWAVFLPIDGAQPLQIALDDASIGRLDLLLHGYFFVDSGRRSISFEPRPGDADQSFRAEWNAMVKCNGTLPLLPATILRAFNELGLTARQKRVIARALALSAWWRAAARESSSTLALAECLSPEGEMTWSIAEQTALRPLPSGDLLPASALRRLFPGFQEWAARRGVVGTFDPTTVLTSGDVAWNDEELSELLSEARCQGAAANRGNGIFRSVLDGFA